MKRRTGKHILTALLFGLMLLAMTLPAQAAAKKCVWVKSGGYYYYYNTQGKKFTGFHTIGKKQYDFDSKGRQLTGWRKVGSKYRYFTIANGKNGSMVTGKKVNGITLDKTGEAVVTSANKAKLNLLVQAQKKVDSLAKPTASTSAKLFACYNYAKNKREKQLGKFRKSNKTWDVYYAKYGLDNTSADCYTRGCLFAYLANAVGMTKVKSISSGQHGWCEINGKIYDPSFEKAKGTSKNYYGKTYKQLPAWNCRFYVIAV
ncbi:MAG: hypothetical protein IJX90_10485 [Blautia sp.]|nr:hypothetical protein [Blautia sp.]